MDRVDWVGDRDGVMVSPARALDRGVELEWVPWGHDGWGRMEGRLWKTVSYVRCHFEVKRALGVQCAMDATPLGTGKLLDIGERLEIGGRGGGGWREQV